MVQKRKPRHDTPSVGSRLNRRRAAEFPDVPGETGEPNGEHDNAPARGDLSDDGGHDLDDGLDDNLDDDQFDPNAGDFLGDFGLDDDEAVPDRNDFWLDDFDSSFD
jgi:hypothetical protein